MSSTLSKMAGHIYGAIPQSKKPIIHSAATVQLIEGTSTAGPRHSRNRSSSSSKAPPSEVPTHTSVLKSPSRKRRVSLTKGTGGRLMGGEDTKGSALEDATAVVEGGVLHVGALTIEPFDEVLRLVRCGRVGSAPVHVKHLQW
jgi:hypothetical protein